MRFFPEIVYALLTLLWFGEFLLFPYSSKDSNEGRRSFLFVLAGIILAIGFSVLFYISGVGFVEGEGGAAMKAAGLTVYTLGILLRYGALFTLGKNFTRNIKDPVGELVSEGPYKYLRHPLYLALMMLVVGTALFLRVVSGMAVSLILMGYVLNKRIREEEEILKEKMGDDYIKWLKKRKLIIPRVI